MIKTLNKMQSRRPDRAEGPTSNHVFIDLTDDPSWRYTVQQGLMEHARQHQQTHGSIVGVTISPKLLLGPAIQFCRNLTGEDVIEATRGAFDIDQFKTGAMKVSRNYVAATIQPLCSHFLATANVSHKHRFGVRQAVLSCLFLYANGLVRATTRVG